MAEQPATNKTVLAVLVQEQTSNSDTDGWLTIPAVIEKLGWDGRGNYLDRRADVQEVLLALVAQQLAEQRERAGADEFRAVRGARIGSTGQRTTTTQPQPPTRTGRHRRRSSATMPAVA